jgi:hypothetical protein
MTVIHEAGQFDTAGNFIGHEPRACGEHRTVGEHRAWCFDCKEWCYPEEGCIRCRYPEG